MDESLPWVEKYRPNTLSEVKGHDWIVEALGNFVSKKKIPHMIFTGPAGTGKTSSAFAMAKDLLGENYSPDQILELNASDNVRMNTVKNEIKAFTSSMGFLGKNSFKLILLDEADNIPREPQQALRRIIEKSPPSVKFIFMCNYENRLIDPIKSRCALFRFTPLTKPIIIDRLKFISKSESLKFNDNFFDILYMISHGDMRKAVNLLQMTAKLDLSSENGYQDLYKIAGFIPPNELDIIKKKILAGKFSNAISEVNKIKGFSGRNFLTQLLNWVDELSLTDKNLGKIIEALSEIDYRMTTGSDNNLQLEASLAFIWHILKTSNKFAGA